MTFGAVRLPAAQSGAVIAAIDAGATAVVVQTDKLPTARAIQDLFQDAGSRVLPGTDDLPEGGAGEAAAPLPPSGAYASSASAEDHARFAPPWRSNPTRPGEPPTAEAPTAAADEPAV
jgi:hypothetical protein